MIASKLKRSSIQTMNRTYGYIVPLVRMVNTLEERYWLYREILFEYLGSGFTKDDETIKDLIDEMVDLKKEIWRKQTVL